MDVIADIFNCSFSTGMVPLSWLTAIVTPVPKLSHPASLSNFRPISVTPILSSRGVDPYGTGGRPPDIYEGGRPW